MWLCDTYDVTLFYTSSWVVSPKEKRKRKINSNLAILPSHNRIVWWIEVHGTLQIEVNSKRYISNV